MSYEAACSNRGPVPSPVYTQPARRWLALFLVGDSPPSLALALFKGTSARKRKRMGKSGTQIVLASGHIASIRLMIGHANCLKHPR